MATRLLLYRLFVVFDLPRMSQFFQINFQLPLVSPTEGKYVERNERNLNNNYR